MKPALSILFFTTLSGSGLGLLAWLGFVLAFIDTAPGAAVLLPAFATGLVLTAAGLLCSLGHLGQPQRAWRALSQWRSSWLSREGVLALLLFPVALLAAWLVWRDAGVWVSVLGVVLIVLAVATLFATAMIYASLRTIPAWANPLVPAAFMAFALLGGWLWLWGVLVAGGVPMGSGALAPLLLAAVALGVVKLAYWRRIAAMPLPGSATSAVGLQGQVPADARVTGLEAPHSEANYITREMVFVFARKHAGVMRLAALVLGVALPAGGFALAWALPGLAFPALALAVLCFQGGALLERWLFFAEARHVVSRYYPTAG
ncbi:dimethyl sulfoxide reductase anchor subunit family protein [Alkalisalibacterium limincola]|uniref:Dimethyl sulfoxide reductase anchor subunit n=1 Tax=Alkalisalibacterium limincola TaxID=2699169 RepID=A0A5C8KXP1_9GAMM|nr:DmsC/YnfH family molybdoenzyme membrane anchor subunit [Alkalisalibacterium limincola]TXK64834.1 dimethyl sulfoxide reductase anchor subunit [Alkalisalibacterium limincola]